MALDAPGPPRAGSVWGIASPTSFSVGSRRGLGVRTWRGACRYAAKSWWSGVPWPWGRSARSREVPTVTFGPNNGWPSVRANPVLWLSLFMCESPGKTYTRRVREIRVCESGSEGYARRIRRIRVRVRVLQRVTADAVRSVFLFHRRPGPATVRICATPSSKNAWCVFRTLVALYRRTPNYRVQHHYYQARWRRRGPPFGRR